MERFFRHYLFSVSLLTGAIIGAGIFSLPFVFKTAGIPLSLFYLLLVLGIYIILHLMYADIIVRTDGEHRFPGLAKMYLGKYVAGFGVLSTVVSSVFVLTVYLVLSTSFLKLVTGAGTDFQKLVIFWLIGSLAIFLSPKKLGLLEFFITVGMIFIIGLISVLGLGSEFPTMSFHLPSKLAFVFLPLAPIFFAVGGRSAIPSVIAQFRRRVSDNIFVRRSVIAGTTVPVIIYLFFALGVLRLSKEVSPDAVTGLVGAVSKWVLVIVGILGLIAIFSSYIIGGTNIKNILRFDLNVPTLLRSLIVVAGPIALYLTGFNQFLFLVGIVGGVFGIFEAIIIILMWRRANKMNSRPPQLLTKVSSVTMVILLLVFAATFIYQIVNLL